MNEALQILEMRIDELRNVMDINSAFQRGALDALENLRKDFLNVRDALNHQDNLHKIAGE